MNNLKALIVAIIGCLIFTNSVHAEEYSEAFQKLTTDGIVRVNAIENPLIASSYEIEDSEWAATMLSALIGQIELGEDSYWSMDCASVTLCEVSIYTNGEKGETHEVTIEYLGDKDETVTNEVQNVMNQINYNSEKVYLLEDINYINYLLTGETKNYYMVYNSNINFVPEIINISKSQNITIKMSYQMGYGTPFSGGSGGPAIIFYNDIAYGYKGTVSLTSNSIFYIPASTEDTKEAYVEAMKQRLSETIPNANIGVTYGGTLEEYLGEDFEGYEEIDLSKTDGNCYNLQINGDEYPFVVVKKEELNKPVYSQVNVETGIQISTTDLSIPLDTTITVNEVEENTEVYNRIVEVLNVSSFKAFDITLYSASTDTVIKKLENGVFQVTIPLGQGYLGKTLAAYYIYDDNTIEEHDIVMDEEGNATFETNHFSTYIITEKLPSVTEENPNTYDGIQSYTILGLLSLLVLGGAIYMNKGAV